MQQIRTIIISAAISALALCAGGQTMAQEGASNAVAAGNVATSLLAAAGATDSLQLVKSKGGGKWHPSGASNVYSGPKTGTSYGGAWKGKNYSSGATSKSGKWKGHRHHHYRRGIGWTTPLIVAPYGYYDSYDSDYDSCYSNCRVYHGPRYCRANWRKYCD